MTTEIPIKIGQGEYFPKDRQYIWPNGDQIELTHQESQLLSVLASSVYPLTIEDIFETLSTFKQLSDASIIIPPTHDATCQALHRLKNRLPKVLKKVGVFKGYIINDDS